MAHLNTDSPFQSWVLSPEEEIIGNIVTSLQRKVIQNHIWQLAVEKLGLKYDSLVPQVFLQREAELAGGINALQYLLTLSGEYEKQYEPGLVNKAIDSTQDNFAPQG